LSSPEEGSSFVRTKANANCTSAGTKVNIRRKKPKSPFFGYGSTLGPNAPPFFLFGGKYLHYTAISALLRNRGALRAAAILACGMAGAAAMRALAAPVISLPVPRGPPEPGRPPTRVSAPLQLASFARTRDGRLHFPGTQFLRTFRRPTPPIDLTEGQDAFVDKADDSGSSVDPILQALRRSRRAHV